MWIRASNLASLGLWMACAAPLVPWLVRGWSTEDGLAQGLVALITAAWVLRGVEPAAAWSRLGQAPRLAPLAVVLAACGPLLGAGTPHETVRALGVALGGYGLAGLFLSPARWRDLRPVLVLAVAVLPVWLMVDVIVGWPVRKGIASVAAALLGGLSTETVIRVEGGMAHVDAPCAGFRGLWAYTALFGLLTLSRGRTVDLRWWLSAGAGAAVLVGANVGRVVAIVGLGHVLGWPLVAESVHQPLGIVGLGLALAVAAAPPSPVRVPSPAAPSARWLSPVLAAILAVAAFRPVPSPPRATVHAMSAPAGWEPIPASAAERAFAAENGAGLTKARLPELGATIVMVESRSWLAHHVPEQCLRAAGWTVSADRPAWVDGRAVRVETVTRDGVQATAVWWFQAGDRTTDDLVVRIREGWTTGEPWVLVSVLVPGVRDPDALAGLIASVRRSVEDNSEPLGDS